MTMTTAEAQAFCTDLPPRRAEATSTIPFLSAKTSAERHVYGVRLCSGWTAPSMSRQRGSNPKEELRRWRDELELVYSDRPCMLMISLAHHVKQLSIPKAYFDELIKGVEMDL